MCVWLCLFRRVAQLLRATGHAHKPLQCFPVGGQTEKEKGTVGESERTTGCRQTHTQEQKGIHKRDIYAKVSKREVTVREREREREKGG